MAHRMLMMVESSLGGIGGRSHLPTTSLLDQQLFRNLTQGKGHNQVVMGSNTYFSLPDSSRPLPGRHNVVLSRNKTNANIISSQEHRIDLEPVEASSQVELVSKWEDLGSSSYDESWIIGGQETFESALEHSRDLEEIHLRITQRDPSCTRFFPMHRLHHWQVREMKVWENGENLGDMYLVLKERNGAHHQRLDQLLPMLQTNELGYLSTLGRMILNRDLEKYQAWIGGKRQIRHLNETLTFNLQETFPHLRNHDLPLSSGLMLLNRWLFQREEIEPLRLTNREIPVLPGVMKTTTPDGLEIIFRIQPDFHGLSLQITYPEANLLSEVPTIVLAGALMLQDLGNQSGIFPHQVTLNVGQLWMDRDQLAEAEYLWSESRPLPQMEPELKYGQRHGDWGDAYY